MPNAQKQLIVSELRDIAQGSKGAILTDYRGLTVAEVTTLRKRLRDVDAEYHIVKNTLFKVALGPDTISPELEKLLTGPTAIAFAKNDVVAPTKTLLDFLRELKKPDIKVKGGYIDGKIYSIDQVTALSKLPSREIIIATLVGTLNGPAAEFVGTLDNIIASFVRTIQAIADKVAEGGGPVGSAPQTEAAAPDPTVESPVVAASAPDTVAETVIPEPTAEAPAEPIAEAAAPEPATETAAPESVAEAPAETAAEPVSETPAMETVAEEAAPEPVAEASAPEPTAETAAPEPATETPAEAPTETAAETPAAETSEASETPAE